jgi:hypothetical protein
MPKKSDYLGLFKALGSSLLLGVTAFVWAATLSRAEWMGLWGLLTFSAALCLFSASKGRGRDQVVLGIAAVTLIGAVIILLETARFDRVTASYAGMLFPLTAAVILWQRQTTGSGKRQRVFLSFLLTALPAIFARRHLFNDLGLGGLLSLSLLMILGSTLYLWGESTGDTREDSVASDLGKTFPTWLVFTSASALFGTLVYLVAPLAFSAAKAVLRLAVTAFGWVLIKVLEPTGFIAEYLINLIRALAKKNEDLEGEGFRPGEPLLEPSESWEAPAAWIVVGYILLALVCILALWLLWRAMKNRSGKDSRDTDDEVSSDWSRQKALKWVLDAGKDLMNSIADFARNLLGTNNVPKDPLLATYYDFLKVAKESGRDREPHETPMEFGEAFAAFLPGVSPEILSVSRDFSRFFYGGVVPSGKEIAAMRVNISSVRTHLSSVTAEKEPR